MEFAKNIRSQIVEYIGNEEFVNSFLNKIYDAVNTEIETKVKNDFYKGKVVVHIHQEYDYNRDTIVKTNIYMDKDRNLWMEHPISQTWLGEDHVVAFVFDGLELSKATIQCIKNDFAEKLVNENNAEDLCKIFS